MVKVSELRYGSVIEDGWGNRKKVVAFGDGAAEREGEELVTTDASGNRIIRVDNITGRHLAIIRVSMLYTYDLVQR